VVPLPGGQCPACRGNTRQPGKFADRVVLEVGEEASLPDLCCHCATITRRSVKVSRTTAAGPDGNRPGSDDDTGAARLIVRLVFGRLLTMLASAVVGVLSSGGGGGNRVTVTIRQCADCSRQGRVDPIQVDFDYYRMRFAVHRRFAEHFQELNRKR
jgi:hypothetical protein